MNEELDSQLSAMFDDELPAAECELLARRLSRDEQLKARWGRYAVIGATIRAERGVRPECRFGGTRERRHFLRSAVCRRGHPAAEEALGRMLVAAIGRRCRRRWRSRRVDRLDASTGIAGRSACCRADGGSGYVDCRDRRLCDRRGQ